MRKRAEKIVNAVLFGKPVHVWEADLISRIEAELTAAVKEERERWAKAVARAVRPGTNNELFERLGQLIAAVNGNDDALAALLTEEK